MLYTWHELRDLLHRVADDPSTPDDPLTIVKKLLTPAEAEKLRTALESAIIARGIPEQVRAEQIEVIRATADLLPDDDPMRLAVESITD